MFIKNVKMKNKLMISFGVIVLLPVFALTLMALYMVSQQIEDGLEKQVENSLSVLQGYFQLYKDRILYNAKVASNLDTVHEGLLNDDKLKLIQFTNIKQSQLGAFSLEIANVNGEIITKSYTTPSKEETDPDSTVFTEEEKRNMHYLLMEGKKEYLTKEFNPSIKKALEYSDNISITSTKDGIIVKAFVPVRSYGDPFGVIILGYLLDQQFIEEAARITGADATVFLDDKAIASTFSFFNNKTDISFRAPLHVVDQTFQTKKNVITVQEIDGKSYLVGYVPIIGDHGTVLGTLSIAKSREQIQTIKIITVWLIIGAALVALLWGFFVAYSIARGITVPILKFVDVAQKISAGDFTSKIEIDTKDEIGVLADSFNTMTTDLFIQRESLSDAHQKLKRYADDLKETNIELLEAKQEIEKWNIELEKKVKERTLELELANDRLEELNDIRTEFLNMATHELRTPITSIKGYSEFLLLGMMGEISGKQSKAVRIIKESGERLLALINDMLDLAKIEAGKIQLQIEAVKLQDVVDINLGLVKPLADEKEITLKTSVPNDLPQVYADKDKLTQVMTNLLSNAIKYTDKDGVITVAVQQMSSTIVQVSIADTGVGIPPEDIDKVFEKFTKIANRPTRKEKGTGLGLPITKMIVETLGGKIWAESEEGKGSIFSFTIPIYTEG